MPLCKMHLFRWNIFYNLQESSAQQQCLWIFVVLKPRKIGEAKALASTSPPFKNVTNPWMLTTSIATPHFNSIMLSMPCGFHYVHYNQKA